MSKAQAGDKSYLRSANKPGIAMLRNPGRERLVCLWIVRNAPTLLLTIPDTATLVRLQSVMNLQNFVTESIVQIVCGIEAANEALKDSTAVVSPKNVKPTDTERAHLFGYLLEPESHDAFRTAVQRIDFDVAVYAEGAPRQRAA